MPCLLSALLVSPALWAGKLSFTIANNLDGGEFDSAELSVSSGGSYRRSVDVGGTFYFNEKPQQQNFNLLSLDIFSSLESVQEYNYLFAVGVRFFALTADLKPAGIRDEDFSYGTMPGIDVGYRFTTSVPTLLLLSFDYAPDIIVGGKLEDMLISNLFYEVMFTPLVITHVSYRYGKARFSPPDVPRTTEHFERSIGVGIKIRY